jgi:hypothetical protein
MIRLKKFLIFFLLAYLFLLVSRFHSKLSAAGRVQEFISSISSGDMNKQKAIVSKLSNYRLKETLEKVFNKNQNEIFNYLVLFDDLSFFKKFLDVKKSVQIPRDLRSSIMQTAISAGSLNVITDLIKKLNFLPTQDQLILSFDSLARVTDVEKIQKFVAAIKNTKLLKTILEQRNNQDQEKDLTAFIHHISHYCNMSWLKAYLDLGGSVKLYDANKDTAFHAVVKTLAPDALSKKVEFIEYMIKQKKIDSLFKNRQDKTACDLAKEYLKKYEKLEKESKNLLFKNEIAKKVIVYKELVHILSKLNVD